MFKPYNIISQHPFYVLKKENPKLPPSITRDIANSIFTQQDIFGTKMDANFKRYPIYAKTTNQETEEKTRLLSIEQLNTGR